MCACLESTWALRMASQRPKPLITSQLLKMLGFRCLSIILVEDPACDADQVCLCSLSAFHGSSEPASVLFGFNHFNQKCGLASRPWENHIVSSSEKCKQDLHHVTRRESKNLEGVEEVLRRCSC